MRRQLLPAVVMLLLFTVITGGLYPLLVTGAAHAAFAGKANGSLVKVDGKVVGSQWIGQPFTAPQYFHPRPQVDGYVAGKQGGGVSSYASNYGPLDPRLAREVRVAAQAYRAENHLGADVKIPIDGVTSSASGLDPHISLANARLQAPRVARARGIPVAEVLRFVDEYTEGRAFGFMGEPGVNVLLLNLALDRT